MFNHRGRLCRCLIFSDPVPRSHTHAHLPAEDAPALYSRTFSEPRVNQRYSARHATVSSVVTVAKAEAVP